MYDPRYEACRILQTILRARAPYDTGNLAGRGIIIENYENCPAVYIGGADVAPYAPYTNEPWVSERWKGRKNPNEGWIERAIEEAKPYIQKALSNRMTEEEVMELLGDYNAEYERRRALRIADKEEKRSKI